MNEGAAFRVLSFLTDTNDRHLASLANEKRKVTIIGEEHEPDEFQEEQPSSSSVTKAETALLSSEQIKEFFKATEDGSIERLDELFDSITNVDPNMTNYTESLLMAAIRSQRRKVAEYLIDQLAIDVNHKTELIEFRLQTKIPIRERIVSCRDLAYEKGMMDLVDLIDITSDEVKPSIKRYLQRRLKTRLDEIHQAYLKRLRERDHRVIFQPQDKENQILEEEELEKENERLSIVNFIDGISLSPPPPPVSHRPYKSRIEETIQKIEANNEKSIDATGKKIFRFSGYTLRYRLVESANTTQQTNERSRSKRTPFSLPTILPTTTRPLPRPMTTATATNSRPRSTHEINGRIPIRETRTSICRSARCIATARAATARVATAVHFETKPSVKPPIATSINTIQRLLPKRMHQIHTNYDYIPHGQHALYNEPRRFMPVTLKATAIGLPSDTRIIRD